jgi:O-antigen/teichoic acid export membrane protein
MQADAARRARQAEGLAALLAIATQASLAMSEASSASLIDELQADGTPMGLLARLRADHMVRNALYLIVSSGLQAGLGFVFWAAMTRLFSTEDVGKASSLISATTVIAYLALLGLNSTLVRYLPTAEDRGALITASFLLVAGCGALIGLVYVAATPVIAPKLSFIDHSPALAAGFAFMCAGAAVNLVTDSVFIASRRAGLCAVTDGGIGGTAKIASGLLLAGTGAYGLFCASTVGFASSALASMILITVVLRWRPALTNPFRTLRPLLHFSAANYGANILNLLPVLIVPLIILDRLGARAAAYYFVAYQIASLLYAGAYAVGQSLLAEGSHAGADRRNLYRRSRRVLLSCYLPAVFALMAISRWVLLIFGPRYSQHGTATLILLSAAAIPIAACNWTWTVLRLSGRLTAIVVSSAIYAVCICGTAWLLAPRGLTALAAAWPIGALLAATAAVIATAISRTGQARHRRPQSPGQPLDANP